MQTRFSVSKMCILLILLANMEFLSLPGSYAIFGSICNYYSRVLLIVGIFMLILSEFQVDKSLPLYKNKYTFLVCAYILMLILVYIYSIFKYLDQSPIRLIIKYYYLFAILFVPPMMKFLKRDGNIKWFLDLISWLGLIFSIYVILVKIIYSFTGILLIDQTMQYVQIRNGGLRLARTATFICVSTIESFALLLKTNYSKEWLKSKYFYSFIFGIISLFYVAQTRATELAILGGCFVMFFLSQRVKKKALIVIALIVFSPFILKIAVEFYNSFFSISDNYILGTQVRLDGYTYFFSHMFDGKIFGLGFLDSSVHSDLLYGPYGTYILSDLGYVGYLGVFGIVGLVFLILLFGCFIRTIKLAKRTVGLQKYPETVGYFVFFSITCFSLMFTDPQRCLYLPFFILFYWIIDQELQKKQFV